MGKVKSDLESVIITELRQVCDERGAVLHMLRMDAPEFAGFGECYFSEVFPGAIKAWKRHRVQTQTLAVPVGRLRMVLYDDRDISSTRGRIEVLELGRPDAYMRLQIPPGLWYGFTCLSDSPAIVANCANKIHDPLESDMRPMDDRRIPYRWT